MRTYRLDGSSVTDLPALFRAFARAVDAPNGYFGKDLASFDDCLFGGFGLIAPCDVVSEHSAVARRHLDSEALVQYCRHAIAARDYADDDGLRWLTRTKAAAERRQRSLFDEVVELILTVGTRAPSSVWSINLVLQ